MRNLRHILLALVFLLHTAFVLAESMRTCCGDEICSVTQCAAMGCAPAATPIAASRVLALPIVATGETYASAPVKPLPAPMKEVWTPPD